MKRNFSDNRFRISRAMRRLMAAFMLASFSPAAVFALPVMPQVISGTASISTSGNAMTIMNSANAIINWQKFSIENGETTRFIQPSAASSVLNRITGGDPSRIFGTLQSNGKVFLINPNGILFGKNARIDVNALVASTLNIANDDFLAGKMKFSAGDISGRIENRGTISTPAGGEVYLIAHDVENSGIITAPNGNVMLAAGKEALLVDRSAPEIAVVVSAPENQALNLGSVIASAGRIGIYGGVIAQKGVISADSAVAEGGKIFLRATRGVTLDVRSMTSANGAKRGENAIKTAEGSALVSGSVEARGAVKGGGSVRLLGERVGLLDRGSVDVSGATGGGTALIGGDYQGKNPEIRNAQATYVGAETVIKADARDSGDGGRVIVWSDEATRAYGTISARGGTNGGNGGLVETSGHWLDVNSLRVSTSAAKGRNGLWLLDPDDIELTMNTTENASLDVNSDPIVWTASGSPSTIDVATIKSNLESPANVKIETSSGDIQVSSALTWTSSNKLTLASAAGISIDAAITGTYGSLDLIATNGGISQNLTAAVTANSLHAEAKTGIALNSPTNSVASFSATNSASGGITFTNAPSLSITGITQSGDGDIAIRTTGTDSDITVNGPIEKNGGADSSLNLLAVRSITVNDLIKSTSNKLDVTLNAHYASDSGLGSVSIQKDIATNGGNLVVGGGTNAGFAASGYGTATDSERYGVYIDSEAAINTMGGNITIRGQGVNNSGPGLDADGINIYSGSLAAGGGNILLAGKAGDNATATSAGIYAGSSIGTTGLGTITLQGNGADLNSSSTYGSRGVNVAGNTTQITTENGTISITGTGSGTIPTNSKNDGVLIAAGSKVKSTANGDISITGIAGSASSIGVTNKGEVNSTGGSITYTADRMALQGITQATGAVTLKPLTTGTAIDLGSTTDSASTTLELSADELNTISAGKLRIGDMSNTGNITISDAIEPLTVSTLSLRSGGTVTQSSAGTISATNLAVQAIGNVALDTATNNVSYLAGSVNGTGAEYFHFKNSGDLTINGIDGVYGIHTTVPFAGYSPGTNGGVIALEASGDITQTEFGGLNGAAVWVKSTGGSVNLPYAWNSETNQPINSTGIISGSASLNFSYGSANSIALLNVAGHKGISANNVSLTSKHDINQDNDAPLVSDTGLFLSAPGPIHLNSPGNSVPLLTLNSEITADSLSFQNSVDLDFSGISTTDGKFVGLFVPGHTLTVSGAINAGTTTWGDVLLSADAGINVNADVTGNGVMLWTPGTANIGGAATVEGSSGVELSANSTVLEGHLKSISGNINIYPTTEGRGIFINGAPPNGHACDSGNCLNIDTSKIDTQNLFIGRDNPGPDHEKPFPVSGDIYIGGVVNRTATGSLALLTGGGVYQLSSDAPITAQNLGVRATGGPIELNVSANQVTNIAATTTGNLSFKNSGSLTIASLTAGNPPETVTGIHAANASLESTGGGIFDAVSSAPAIVASSVSLAASTGIGSGFGEQGTPLKTQVSTLSATNTGTSGDINILNTGPLTTSGWISNGNPYNTSGGRVTIRAKSPLTIGSTGDIHNHPGGISALNEVWLEAGASGTGVTTDNLTINGNIYSDNNKTVTLRAGNSIIENGTIQGGTIVRQANLNPAPPPPPPPPPPTVDQCVQNPALSGCSSVLPSLNTCTSAPTTPGCSAVLPPLATCTSAPSTPGCSAVLPQLSTCTTAPSTPGCSAVLPPLSTCTSAPTTPGCSAVLPPLATCTTAPATPGCSAVLPSLNTCTTAPTTPGCSAVLPPLATCTSAPSTPGCSAVLPSLNTCTSAPTTPGCSAVLPTLATCTSAPSTPGCSAVLPPLATCTTAPTTPGCSAVLPPLSTCTSAPSTPGCSAVLPPLATCTSAPSTPGCAAVLPPLSTCTSAPATPGCSAVLPPLATCTSAPSTPGCSAVLPPLSTCTSAPTTPGCSAVLPPLATCTTAPATPGCSAVLPSLSTCTTAPATPGCSAVLPSVDICSANPTTPGCSAVLPSLNTCTTAPSTPGCAAVLPPLATCTSAPTTPGCSAVLPSLNTCTSAPTTPGCSVVLPPNVTTSPELAPQTTQIVNDINSVNTNPVAPSGLQALPLRREEPPPPATQAQTQTQSSAGSSQEQSGSGSSGQDDKKDKDKDKEGQNNSQPSQEGKKDENPQKNYCN